MKKKFKIIKGAMIHTPFFKDNTDIPSPEKELLEKEICSNCGGTGYNWKPLKEESCTCHAPKSAASFLHHELCPKYLPKPSKESKVRAIVGTKFEDGLIEHSFTHDEKETCIHCEPSKSKESWIDEYVNQAGYMSVPDTVRFFEGLLLKQREGILKEIDSFRYYDDEANDYSIGYNCAIDDILKGLKKG